MKIASAPHRSGERLWGVAAIALGILVAVLFLAWLWQEPPVGAPVPAAAPAGDGDVPSAAPPAPTVGATTGAMADATTADATAAKVPVPERASAARGSEAAAVTAVLYGAVRTPEPLDALSARRVRGFVRLFHDGKQEASAGVSDCFAFPGLRPDRYELRVEREGHVPAAVDVEVTAPRTRVDVDLEPAWLLTVNVRTPGGESFAAAVRKAAPELLGLGGLGVVALREPLTADLPPSTTRSPRLGVGRLVGNEDRFDRPALPEGVVGVLQLPNGTPLHVALLMRNVLLGTQLIAPGQDEVTFTLSVDALLAKTATLRLRVVDAAGSPVAARIGLSDRSSGGRGKAVDGEGRIVLVAQRPGRLNLDMQAHPLALPYFDVLLPVGGEVDLGEVIALPAADVEFEGGDEAMRLYCVAIDPPPHRSLSARRISASGESLKRPLRLYPGRYHVLATSGDRMATASFDTRTLAGPVRLDLRVAPQLTLKNEVGARLVGLVVHDQDGVLVYERELSGRWQTTMPLPAGTYTATLTDLTGAVTQRRFGLGTKGYVLTVP